MASIIVYLEDVSYIDKTIDDILSKTVPSDIDEIVVCDDKGLGYCNDRVKVVTSDHVGYAKACNLAVESAQSDKLIFLHHATKVADGWLQPLLQSLDDENVLVSPVVHVLDAHFWTMQSNRWLRFGWRWDLKLYDRPATDNLESPAISPYCIAVNKQWLTELGSFDCHIKTSETAAIELSLRCWLLGGRVIVNEHSVIAVVPQRQNDITGLARIVEAWLPNYTSHFYDSKGIKPTDINIGRLDNLIKLRDNVKISPHTFLSTHMPELLGVYDLRKTASGKSIAIVNPGPSLDEINLATVYKHDIIIGVDYASLLVDCHYVVSDDADTVVRLRDKYSDKQFILPTVLSHRVAGKLIAASDVAPECVQFEIAQQERPVVSITPPFCNFDNPVHSAIHFALFLNPLDVVVYGCDNKIIGNKSHSSRVEYYDNGELWSDSAAIRQRFARFEYGLDQLGKLAKSAGITLLRMNHV